jgi:histidinol dehydrogenase
MTTETTGMRDERSSGAAAGVQFAFDGAVAGLRADDRRRLLDRSTSVDARIRDRVAGIIADVRQRGDEALRELARELDRVDLDSIEVPRVHWQRALDDLEPALRRAMERSIANVETAHRAALPASFEVETEPGIVVGRRPDPLARVGVYAPGGRAAYPSSVVMGAVPARVAGVTEVVVCSPPSESGAPSAVVLAAAALVGVDRVFALGGAGAIAALAYGTSTVPRVDRIVGPGNAYVAEAKLQVSGAVAIDSPAGPSELLVIADDSADPVLVARELIAQAEHDPDASAIAIAIGSETARRIRDALSHQVPNATRADIVRGSMARRGGVLAVDTMDQAIALANDFAAEHVMLVVESPERVMARLRNAGTVFVGPYSSVAFGDYMTGANHVLPTGGLARSYSGLSVLDYFRWTSYQRVSAVAAARLADDVAVFADAERLPGHAAAARAWRAS